MTNVRKFIASDAISTWQGFDTLLGHGRLMEKTMASWRSGDAEDCKSLHAGSIPAEASIFS